ncbi:hypothetical protein ATL10_10616 [Bacillus sp. 196mf]|nr:hypothetical protein ATL10_10616 [Bacillus sp. 196mf]
MEYPAIAKKVWCKVSSVYKEFEKRGVLQMPKQEAPKVVKSSTLSPQTKKSAFQRYKEYYMCK